MSRGLGVVTCKRVVFQAVVAFVTLEDVKKAYKEQIDRYLPEAMEAGEVKYSRIAAALAAVEGANDYTDVRIGLKDGETVTYGVSNITISTGTLPSLDEDDLILTAGTV